MLHLFTTSAACYKIHNNIEGVALLSRKIIYIKNFSIAKSCTKSSCTAYFPL